jgi:hypothetical protein
MADHDENGRERLLDAVLAEHLRGDDARLDDAARVLAGTAAQRDAAWRRAQRAGRDAPVRQRWLVAVALAGVAVVAATAWLRRESGGSELRPPAVAQDPALRTVQPRDLAHFVELVKSATALRVGGSDAVGATQVHDATGSYDRLDVERWPEVLAVVGDPLDAWRAAVGASARALERRTRLGTLLSTHFVQPDGSVLIATCSAGDEVFLDPGLDAGVITPDAALRALIQGAHGELLRVRRAARGEANDAAELDALPATSAAVAVPWLPDGSLPKRLRRFTGLRTLAVRGALSADALRALAAAVPRDPVVGSLEGLELSAEQLGDDDVAVLGAFSELQRLTLRGGSGSLTGTGLAKCSPRLGELSLHRCGGLTPEGLRALSALWSLRALRLDECGGERVDELVDALPSLPSLQHLALRGDLVSPRRLEPLLRTKLRSLRLVDVPVAGVDLEPFAQLPTLRELAVLARTIDDGEVDAFGALRQVERFELQNTRLTADGLVRLRELVAPRAVECTVGQRRFDSAAWLR